MLSMRSDSFFSGNSKILQKILQEKFPDYCMMSERGSAHVDCKSTSSEKSIYLNYSGVILA